MYTLQEAKDSFSNMTLIALFFGIACTVPVSILADRIQPKFMMLPGFLFRGIFLVLFVSVENPTTWKGFACATCITASQAAEVLVMDSILFRNIEKEIRGLIFGIHIGLAFMGQLFSLLLEVLSLTK